MSPNESVADTETVELPPAEKVAINSMADKFRGVMDAIQPEQSRAESNGKHPAEPPAEQATVPPELKGKPREQFAKLEAMMKQYRAEADSLKPAAAERDKLKAELEEVRKGDAQLKQQLEERDLALKQFAIERHPQFQQHFGERIQSATLEAKEAVGEHAASEVDQIFSLPPSAQRDAKVEELAELLSDMRRIDLLSSYRTLKQTEKERQAELAKAPENWRKIQELQNQAALEQQAQEVRHRAALLQHITAEIEPDLNGADVSLAKSIRESVAEMVEGRAGTDRYVETLTAAAKWKRYQGTIKEQAETIAKLEAQLAELQGSTPQVRATGAGAPAKRGEPRPIGDVFREAMSKRPRAAMQPA